MEGFVIQLGFSSDDPIKEVKIGNEILKSLNLRNRGKNHSSILRTTRFWSNWGCKTRRKVIHIKTPITLSAIGCVVNGPGEAASTDIGITGGGKDSNMLYLKGVQKENWKQWDNFQSCSIIEKKEKDIKNKI